MHSLQALRLGGVRTPSSYSLAVLARLRRLQHLTLHAVEPGLGADLVAALAAALPALTRLQLVQCGDARPARRSARRCSDSCRGLMCGWMWWRGLGG